MLFFTRSTISCAVTAAAARAEASVEANGVATAPTAASATKSRREISGMPFSPGPCRPAVPGPGSRGSYADCGARVIALFAPVMPLV